MDPRLSLLANRALASLQRHLPKNEWEAVNAWRQSFYRYQQEWLLDFSRFSLISKARQIGASHTIGAWAVLMGLLGETTTVVSMTIDDANEVIDKSVRHARVLHKLGSEWAQTRPKSGLLTFTYPGCGRIISRPQSSGGRGLTGNVVLDEIAYYEHPDAAWDGAGGSILHGYKIRCCSTPNGVGNFWHGLWSDPVQHYGYRLHEYTIDHAIADGMKVDLAECWKQARGDERVFNQLFRCSFLDNDMQYLPTDLVRAIITMEKPPDGGTCYGGLDVGKSVDLSVLTIVRYVNGCRWVTHIESRRRTSDDDIDQLIALAFNVYNCSRIAIDSTGMGAFPAERNVKKWGLRRVIPVDFTLKAKEDMATGLYQMAVERQVKVPHQLGNIVCLGTTQGLHPERQAIIERLLEKPRLGTMTAQLAQDLLALRRIVTPSGNVTYDAPHTAEGHADSAWSLCLALLVARSEAARGVWDPAVG